MQATRAPEPPLLERGFFPPMTTQAHGRRQPQCRLPWQGQGRKIMPAEKETHTLVHLPRPYCGPGRFGRSVIRKETSAKAPNDVATALVRIWGSAGQCRCGVAPVGAWARKVNLWGRRATSRCKWTKTRSYRRPRGPSPEHPLPRATHSCSYSFPIRFWFTAISPCSL